MASPLVSCILPTKNRAKYIAQAIQSYQSQTYPYKELIIVDNGEDGTEKLVPDDPSIKYVSVTGSHTTGEMRNLCVKQSAGDIICHFDSDDWSAPGRVVDQVTRLGTQGVVTGYYQMLFYDERTKKCYLWKSPSNPILLGTSLCYQRIWWRHHPFSSLQIGEDIRFFQNAQRLAARQVSYAPARQLMVARVHDHQTSRKVLTSTSYHPMSPASLPEMYAV